MKILTSYHELPTLPSPCALSIGNFDGVHLGHQAVIARLKEKAPFSALFTFTNHPDEVLYHKRIVKLTTLPHRLALFEHFGIDIVIILPFTTAFSTQTAEQFLSKIKSALKFDYLILGHDGVIGNDRNTDLTHICKKLGIDLEYLKPVEVAGMVISSSAIRQHINAGELAEASLLLGRPYSIQATVQQGMGFGRVVGFHTANLAIEDLILPPLGVYVVEVVIGEEKLPAVANLGYAPTLHHNRPPLLEVHLLGGQRDLYGATLDVHFLKYLRPEQKFPTTEALKHQIQQDILAASYYLSSRK